MYIFSKRGVSDLITIKLTECRCNYLQCLELVSFSNSEVRTATQTLVWVGVCCDFWYLLEIWIGLNSTLQNGFTDFCKLTCKVRIVSTYKHITYVLEHLSSNVRLLTFPWYRNIQKKEDAI